MTSANTASATLELDETIQKVEVEIPEQLIQDYKELREKVDQTITKIKNKRSKTKLKK